MPTSTPPTKRQPYHRTLRRNVRSLEMGAGGVPRRLWLRPLPFTLLALALVVLAKPSDSFLAGYRGHGLDGFGICPSEVRNCSCRSFTGSETEIDCPESDPTVHLRIEPHQYAEMRCQRNRRYEFDQIPQLAIGDTNRLTIDDCPFPHRQSILQLVSFLGTTQVKVLWLKNNANHEQSASLGKRHFAGLDTLDRLAISNAKLTDIESDVFEHLPNLTWLDMRDNVIRLPPTIFDALPKLRILELSFNSLEEVEPRLLKNLPHLRLLTLWHNKLRTVSRQLFAGVPELERLDLSANQLETVPGDLFLDLPQLTELAMGFNYFRTLPNGLFRANRELRKLKLASQRVQLETVPSDLLQYLPFLDQVNLERCGLARLPETLLHGSLNVTHINLAYNRLQQLPKDLLMDQVALQVLQLQHNELTELPRGLLRNTVELRLLRLSHNQISELSADTLKTLTKLEELYLDHNQLQTIEMHAFRQTGALHTLHLQANQLAFETFNALSSAAEEGETSDIASQNDFGMFVQEGTPFQHLHRLRELDLSSNWLTAVPRDLLLNTHELQRLNLTRNNITSLTYANLQFLAPSVTVDLRHNSIFEIDLADMERLVLLDQRSPDELSGRARILLDENPLNCNCIVYAFAQYVQRRLATAVYDRIELMADALACQEPEHLHGTLIRNVPTRELLCELDTPSTQIRHCPPACRCFIRPEDTGVIVDCSGQGLTQVPELPRPTTFGYRFIELHIEDNNISALPEAGSSATGGWNEVRELFASNNTITTLETAQLPDALRLLDLRRNRLTEFGVPVTEALAAKKSLTTMRLAHNDWTCQCEASHFLTFVHANQRRIEDFGRLQCADGRQLDQTTLSDLCLDSSHAIILACVIMSIVACLFAVLSFVYFAYKLEFKVWLFKHGLCLWLVAEEELDRDKVYDAFISYSHKDEAFITEHLVPTLEREPMNFKLCWHVRDFMPGEMITSQIASSVEQSRRTIIVLSTNFLESLWGQLEFRTAHLQSMAERRNRLIIIIYGDIGNIDELDPELRAYLHTNTYVRWGDPWFWDKVRFAMPHPPKVRGGGGGGGGGGGTTGSGTNVVKSGVSTAGGLFMKQRQGSTVDDKLELIKPQTAPATPPVLTTPPTEPVNPSVPAVNTSSTGTTPTGPFIISGHGGGRSAASPLFHPQHLHPYRVDGHINGAFVINSNAKQSDV
uniref:TIR domain-containing protein n=1 Tax=Anopheles farauti TaxID=69004 RepID=A0A182QPS8_9DIPT